MEHHVRYANDPRWRSQRPPVEPEFQEEGKKKKSTFLHKFRKPKEHQTGMSIGTPHNVVHEGHVGFNTKSGEFETRLPQEYQKLFGNLNGILKEMGVDEISEKESKMILKSLPLPGGEGENNLVKSLAGIKQTRTAQALIADSYKKDLDEQKRLVREIQAKLGAKEKEVAQLGQQMAQLQGMLSDTRTKLLSANSMCASQESQLLEYQEQILALKEEMLKSLRDVTMLAEEKNRMQTNLQQVRTKMAAEATRNGMLQFKVDQLMAKVKTMESQRRPSSASSVDEELRRVQDQLESQTLLGMQLQTENSELKEEVDQLRLFVPKVKEMQEKMSELRTSMDTVRARDRSNQKEIQQRDAKIKRLEEELAMASSAESRARDLEQKLAVENDRAIALERKLAEMSSELANATKKQLVYLQDLNLPPPPPPVGPPPSLDSWEELPPPPPPPGMEEGGSQRDEGREKLREEAPESKRSELMASIKEPHALRHVVRILAMLK